MDKVEEQAKELLRILKEGQIYQEYIRQQERLEADPDLNARVDRYRLNNYRMHEDDSLDMYTLADNVSQELSELRKIPEVNAYLDAELALCRQIQKICRTLIEGIDMNVPDLHAAL